MLLRRIELFRQQHFAPYCRILSRHFNSLAVYGEIAPIPRCMFSNRGSRMVPIYGTTKDPIRWFSDKYGGVDVIELGMPALSPTMESGTIAVWHKQPGDEISAGEVLADVETDKATVAFESVEDGFMAAILVDAGTPDVPVGTIAALMVEEIEDIEAISKIAADMKASPSPPPSPSPSPPSPPSPPSSPSPSPSSPSSPSSFKQFDGPMSPAVAVLINTHKLDPASIEGTGKGGRLLKGDVLSAMAAGTARASVSHTPPTSTPVAATPTLPAARTPAADPDQFAPRSVGRGIRTFQVISKTDMSRRAVC